MSELLYQKSKIEGNGMEDPTNDGNAKLPQFLAEKRKERGKGKSILKLVQTGERT